MSYSTKAFRPRFRQGPSRRTGSVFAFSIIMMIGLLSITSLAVDYGHVQLVKSQLRAAADAAALAGVAQLQSGTGPTQLSLASSVAIQTAGQNTVDGQQLVLLNSDVQVGNWDSTQTPNFSTSRTPTNAVSISAHRCAARNTAVPLVFGSIFGAPSCDVSAPSIALVATPGSNYGIVGINHANFSSLGVLAQINGDIASDGDINIGNPTGLLVSVTGSAKTYQGYVSHGGLATIAGTGNSLSQVLNYPPVLLPAGNGNSNIAAYLDSQNNFIAMGYASIPSGTYVVHDLNILADLDMDLQGPVTFYVTGSFNIAASVNLLGNTNTDPSNFTVNLVAGATVNFVGAILAPLCMDLYAPQSPINITVGITSFTGELIGQTLDITLPVLGVFNEVKPSKIPTANTIVQ